MEPSRAVVIGVDVGGASKGFHAVALRSGQVFDRIQSRAPNEIARWCRDRNAAAVGVDAPCCWRSTGYARAAERDLAREGISAFATPTHEIARTSPFYRWMLNGAELYRSLETDFRLFCGEQPGAPACFETFPQAVACALAGEIVAARQKCGRRRALLEQTGMDTHRLANIDFVDAALCAVAAQYFAVDSFKAYGNAASGFILVPRLS